MSKRVRVIVEGREYIVEVGDLEESPIRATVNRRTYQVEVPQQQDSTGEEGEVPVVKPAPVAKKSVPSTPAVANSAITAPMPGNIIDIKVKAGDTVQSGDVVCVLEAMKMNNLIRSIRTGVVASVDVRTGQAVDYGEVLVTFE